MSGAQIGTVVGGVIGSFFGMTQLGMAIGGMIGGWIDPTQVNGPRIGDGASQSSKEGQPIPWVIGTCGWIQGNLVDKSPRREVKKTDDGKGSGTEINTFEAHQDFVLMICESSEHRESVMTGVLIVKVDGKIVYDMRPDKNFGAQNAKFLRNHTFYNGNESQMPDPTCEAFPHNGVGNTPYYRGVFTMVARDINLTQYGDRVPVYEFVMVGAGENVTTTVTSYSAPNYGRFGNQDFPLLDPQSHYTFIGVRNPISGPSVPFAADSIEEIVAHFSTGLASYGGAPSRYIGYSASSPIEGTAGDPQTSGDFGINRSTAQPDVSSNVSLVLAYQNYDPAGYFDTDGSGVDACSLLGIQGDIPPVYADRNGFAMAKFSGGTRPDLAGYAVCGGSEYVSGMPALYISVFSRTAPPTAIAGDPCLLGAPVLFPDAPGLTIDCAGNIAPLPTYTEVEDFSLRGLQAEVRNIVAGQRVFLKKTLGPIIVTGSANDNQTFWEAAYDNAVARGDMEPGLVWNIDYPVSTPNVWLGEYATTDLSNDTVSLATAITRICKRGGLTISDIDVSEMDQQLMGYMITQPYSGADCIRPLMTAFTAYGSEYDGKLRFHNHGENIEVIVNPDDFIAGSDETDKNTREQEIEYPRLLSVTAIDATQDYTPRPQVDRRTTPDIRAIGEEQMQVPIVMSPDSQRQLASIGMKVSWARAQGKREFSVPYATATGLYLYLVAGKPFALEGKRYIAQNVRLEDGEIHFEAVYDRQSAYTSDVTATPALPPTAPPSSIGGVTLFAAMNLPRLRSKDSTPGMYIAVDGLLDSWPGCALQMSIDDEATWTTAIGSMTQSSVMGYLTAPIDASPTSTLSVAVHGGTLDSITDARLADGGNPWAVITGGVSEVGQFKTAAETDPDKYDLTDLVRGGLGTTAAAHAQGDRFVELDNVYFLPLDISLSGRVIKFRPVTFGTPPESNAVYAVTFRPLFSGPQVSSPLTVGGENITVDGAPIFVVTYA